MHYRKEIRAAITAILKGAAIPRIENNVYPFRLSESQAHAVPSLSVYTVNETGVKFNESPRMHARGVNVIIEVRDSHPDDDGTLPDKVDDLCNYVEQAILSDTFLGTWNGTTFCIEDTEYTGTEYNFDATGNEYAMHASISFSVTYKSDDSLSQDALSDLLTITYGIEQGVADENDFTGIINYD